MPPKATAATIEPKQIQPTPANMVVQPEPQAPVVDYSKPSPGKPRLDQEYVSSYPGWSYVSTMIRALPAYIDDITRDFGTAQYDRMMTDAQVNSVVKIYTMAVLAEDVQLRPALPKEDPNFDRAQKITDFCDHVLRHLDKPLVRTLYDLVEGALVNGHKLAEQVYAIKTIVPADGPQVVLTKLKPKPLRATAFVSDPYGNIPGVLYATPMMPVISGLISYKIEDIESLPNFMPRSKFALFTNLAQDEDPRGRSVLRPIYTFWWVKQQIIPELLKYLARFGSPSVLGFTDPEASDEDQGDGTVKSPQQVMLAQLEAIRNGAVGAFPSGAKLQLLEAQREGGPFLASLEQADMQIAKGVLLQTLATEQGEHMARSAAQVHQDVLGTLILFTQVMVIDMVEQDILTPLVRYNFGDDAMDLVPNAIMGDVNRQDFGSFAHGVSEMAGAGLIDDSQKPGIWEMLGLPPVDEDVLAAREAEQQQAMASLQKANEAAAAQSATRSESEVVPINDNNPAVGAPAQTEGQGAQKKPPVDATGGK